MTVNNIKSLILIWLFVSKTCIKCNHILLVFPGPRYVPVPVQNREPQVPGPCQLCSVQKILKPVIPSVGVFRGTLMNNVPLRHQLPKLRPAQTFIGRHAFNEHQSPLVVPNSVKLQSINQQIHRQLTAKNEMLRSLTVNALYLLNQESMQHPNIPRTINTPNVDRMLQLNRGTPLTLSVPILRTGKTPVLYNDLTTSTNRGLSVTSAPVVPEHLSTNVNNTINFVVPTATENKTGEPAERDSLDMTEVPDIRRHNLSLSHNQTLSTTVIIPSSSEVHDVVKPTIQQELLTRALEQFERKFYSTTFLKLTSISPPERKNGISFVESGLFLYLNLAAMSTLVDNMTELEIAEQLALPASDADRIEQIRLVLDMLPASSDELKFRWSSRLVVNGTHHFSNIATSALRMKVDSFPPTEDPVKLVANLNSMIEEDSGGAMRDTFEEDELAEGARAIFMNTVYVRARWRASPTLLNDSLPFYDGGADAPSPTRMIRINDIMGYAYLPEWDAEAVEISYSTPGLSLLLVVPRGRSLRALVEPVTSVSLEHVTSRLRSRRVAATLPIYTLRMTLLLPNKLEAMNLSRLVDTNFTKDRKYLHISHAVQRLMFWAEAGRNAYKDDGIEWDESPELKLVVDRPYIFFVRWHNLTLMNGNFVH